MANIVPFPGKTKKNVNPVADMIIKYLAAISNDCAMIAEVSAQMNTFVETYADIWFEPTFDLELPAAMTKKETAALLLSIEKGVDRAAEQVNEIISKIVIERLLLEVQIYEDRQSAAAAAATADKAAKKAPFAVRPLSGDEAGPLL